MKQDKKIIICCNSFPPEKGGAPARIYNLAKLLTENGYLVTVITAMPNYPTGAIFPGFRGRLIAKERMEGIQVIRLWLVPSHSSNIFIRAISIITYLCSFLILAAPRIIFRKSDEVIISSPPLVNAWLAAIVAKLGRKKIIVNISDIWPLTATEMGAIKEGFAFRLLQKMECRLYKSACAFTGQSQEILDHIQQTNPHNKPAFLYRNLQDGPENGTNASDFQPKTKFIYAGNLGHAQGILDLCNSIRPAAINATLDIFGDGAERSQLEQWVTEHPDSGIRLYPTITQQVLNQQLKEYAAIIIPLRIPIQGAVPSKLFMAIANQIPVLFCGGGEGAAIVQQHRLGLVSGPGDYAALQQNMQQIAACSLEEIQEMHHHIRRANQQFFSKKAQDERYLHFLKGIL